MRKIACALSIALLVGCASTAGNDKIMNHSQASVDQIIIPGKTTKSDVKAEFGEPTAITLNDSGSENWTYTFARASAKGVNYVPIVNLFARGVDVSTKRMVILFDKNNIAQKVVFTENNSEVASGGAAAK